MYDLKEFIKRITTFNVILHYLYAILKVLPIKLFHKPLWLFSTEFSSVLAFLGEIISSSWDFSAYICSKQLQKWLKSTNSTASEFEGGKARLTISSVNSASSCSLKIIITYLYWLVWPIRIFFITLHILGSIILLIW